MSACQHVMAKTGSLSHPSLPKLLQPQQSTAARAPFPEPSGTCALGNCQVQRSSRTVQLRAANIFQRHSIKANGFHFCLVV